MDCHSILSGSEIGPVYADLSANLYDRQRDPEEGEDMRADEAGNDQQNKAVDCNTLGQKSSRYRRIIACQREENRAAAQRIDDGE